MQQLHITAPALLLDACRPCGAIWFDPGEFQAVPEGALESPDEVMLRGQEAIGVERLELMREREQLASAGASQPPDETWKWLPAFLGLPVEMEGPAVNSWPWLVWTLAAVIAVVSIVAFLDLENAVARFGLIPADCWRYGGATMLTSFFLHGGVLHLIGNLYFLLLCGRSVEDYLGRWRFACLIVVATLAGDCLHILADSRKETPCIGASGGISGVLVFYALEFPRARLGFLFRYFWWITLPAWGAFALWILLQLLGAWMQFTGFSRVSSLAHLGGVLAGSLLWLYWRKLAARPAPA